MLVERNENKKAGAQATTKYHSSPKRAQKSLKENFLQFNTKELLLKSSKLHVSEPPQPTDDFFLLETNKVRADFLKKIMAHELGKAPEAFRPDFLKSHLLSPEIRARMVCLQGRLDDRSPLQLQLHRQHLLRRYRHHGQLPGRFDTLL